MRPWYELDPTGVMLCPLCGCPVQRTPKGTIEDGLAAHRRAVHSGRETDTQPTGALAGAR